MNTTLVELLLILTPLLPLLLALPALRSRIAWPCHIALLPALMLLAVPTGAAVELPWLLLGSGLGIDGGGRLLLTMSVLLWAVVATLLHTAKNRPVDNRLTTFFLLTLGANLGVILATDLVIFFAFLVLMGYAFYGLLITGAGRGIRRTTRLYLVLLILSDLALFEALLIAVSAAGNPSFEAVRQAMAESPSLALYLSMVLVGFAARAAIWPLHFWLLGVFRSTQPALVLLLAGVPVVIALLGMVRWLPLGEIALPNLGLGLQGLGIVSILYALFAGLKRLSLLTAYAVIFATGLFVIALGMGFSDPTIWKRYENFAYLFMICLSFGAAVLFTIIGRLQAKAHYFVTPENQVGDPCRWFEAILRWAARVGGDIFLPLRDACYVKISHFKQTCGWQKILAVSEGFLQRWYFSITLLLLLAMAFIFLVAD